MKQSFRHFFAFLPLAFLIVLSSSATISWRGGNNGVTIGSSFAQAQPWKRSARKTNEESDSYDSLMPPGSFANTNRPAPDDIPSVPWLVEYLGKEIYSVIKAPKYKFYIYMTIGTLPDETSTVMLLSVVCNILYCCLVVAGFFFLPRMFMLFITLVTLPFGPALVLIVIGAVGGTLVAFATYPILSVMAVWVVFFSTSQLAQKIGMYLGLDSDEDGDVDFLDILHWMSRTTIGKWIGLPHLYEILDEASKDPFKEIHRRLDEIQRYQFKSPQ